MFERIIGGFMEESSPWMNPHHTLEKISLKPWGSMENWWRTLTCAWRNPWELEREFRIWTWWIMRDWGFSWLEIGLYRLRGSLGNIKIGLERVHGLKYLSLKSEGRSCRWPGRLPKRSIRCPTDRLRSRGVGPSPWFLGLPRHGLHGRLHESWSPPRLV